jgi:hypothetical protein
MVQVKRRIKRRFTNDLNHDLFVEKLGLELVMEVPQKVRLRFLRHVREKRVIQQEADGNLYGHESRVDGLLGTGDRRQFFDRSVSRD